MIKGCFKQSLLFGAAVETGAAVALEEIYSAGFVIAKRYAKFDR